MSLHGDGDSFQSTSSALDAAASALGGVRGAPNTGSRNPGGILVAREAIAAAARSESDTDDPGLAETEGGLRGAGFATANENRGM